MSGGSLEGSDSGGLHQGWIMYTTAQEGEEWKPAWCVLTDKRIMLYSSDHVRSVNIIYSLKLSCNCGLQFGSGDSFKGFEFSLEVAKRNVMTIKVKTAQERELWVTTIHHVISGAASKSSTPHPSHPKAFSSSSSSSSYSSNLLPPHPHPHPHHPHPAGTSHPAAPPPPSRRPSLPIILPSSYGDPPPLPPTLRQYRKLSLGGEKGGFLPLSPPPPPPPSLPLPPPPSLPPPPPPCYSRKGKLANRNDSGVEDYMEPMSPSFEESDEPDADYEKPEPEPQSAPPEAAAAAWDRQSLREEGGPRWDDFRRQDSHRSQDSGRGSGYFEREEKESPSRKQSTTTTPTWLFYNCPRALAERILRTCAPDFGNTLMRSTPRDPGYSISKRCDTPKKTKSSEAVIDHYKVLEVNGGYRFDVNDYAQVMRSVEEVMAVFVEQNSSHLTPTFPLTCNHLPALGVPQDDPLHPAHSVRGSNEGRQQPPPLPPRF